MSALSQLLTERNPNGWSARELGRGAEANGYELRQATVTRLFGGRDAKLQTLEAIASALPVTVREMREALDLPADPGDSLSPPDEARQLTADQRAALGQLIETTVIGGQQDGQQPEAQKTDDPVDDGQLQVTTRDETALAARRSRLVKDHVRARETEQRQCSEESQDDGGMEPV